MRNDNNNAVSELLRMARETALTGQISVLSMDDSDGRREESLVLEVFKPLETHSVLRDSGDQPGSEVGARAGHIQAENRTQTTVLPWKEVSSRFLQQGLSTGNFPSFILLKTPISKRFFKTMNLLLCLQFKINGIFS